jgi:LPPG:FO 2-phospho-L-lactate transferase
VVSKVVALAGGVGGARLAQGLYQAIPDEKLTIIVNTGDDFIFNGLNISPDLDTVCYTLAGVANAEKGWGIKDDSFNALERIKGLGGEDWFAIGDRDIGTHLYRTSELNKGIALSEVTRHLCNTMGITAHVIPMTNETVQTKVRDKQGNWLDFQEYFVHRFCEPKVKEFNFAGSENAQPAPGVLDALEEAELVVICPSNPWVSIDPILSIHKIKNAIAKKCVLAVSPLIGGKAVKGPLAKMFGELGIKPSSLAIAEHYQDILKGLVIDQSDSHETGSIEAFGIITKTTDIFMKDAGDRKRLAFEVLEFGEALLTLL